MKKIVITVLLLINCCIAAQAQFGISAGFGLGKYKYYVDGVRYKRSNEFTYTFGAYYDYKPGTIGIRPALDYAPIITKIDAAGLGTGILYYRNRLNYLRLALPVTINLGSNEDHSWYGFQFGAGPFFSRLLKATSTAHDLEDNEKKTDFKVGTSASDAFKPGDVGLQLYIGVRVRHLSGSITDNLGYHNITAEKGAKIMTRSFMVNLGVHF